MDWVQSRRAMVDKLSGGRIGYIHVPDTGYRGNAEFFKGFYAYEDKDALIIDERYNSGGFLPDVMIETLNKNNVGFWAKRAANEMNKARTHDGPKVMLTNHYSGSGGDEFAYLFKKLKIGKLIGTRTWGGLVGVAGDYPFFIDGGFLFIPEFGFVDTEGNWAVEGKGVSPDIEVWDAPDQVAKGRDPSIEKAVEVLLQELENNPPKKVKKPAPPDRSGWIK